MPQTAQADLLIAGTRENVAASVADRLSQELVIALVGPVGSGVSTAAAYIEEILTQDFDYKVAPIIKPSDIIRSERLRVNVAEQPTENPLNEYIDKMQSAGNQLREKFGADYLAEKAVEKIWSFRKDKGGIDDKGIHLPGRRAYIIDSLKNIEELNLFRQIYGVTLCVFGVFAPDAIRKKRLINNGAKEFDVQKIIDRDQGEVATFGQMTRKVFGHSDFFICNDNKKAELRQRLSRYLNIIFSSEIHTPTRAESAMYKASAAAANSACMSRQVGAAIVSEKGELISIGWNDVPKFGGGLYREDDQSVWKKDNQSIQDFDNRCFKWNSKICHNDNQRSKILDGITKKIAESGIVKKGIKEPAIRKVLAGTEVDSLTEFSRSIHAEMEAILSVAREGRHSLVGATLYSTTYPCHNCARHIVASGIKSVVYIQPYAKSLATKLHNDAISEESGDSPRVVFRQYDGVAPLNFLRLFTSTSDRKTDGKVCRANAKKADPVFRIPLDAPADYEAKVIADLEKKEDDS